MARILDAARHFFESDGWTFSQVEDHPILHLPFQGDNGRWSCYAEAREEFEQFAFYSVCPVNAPADRRPAVTEFLTRANSGLLIGNFEIDLADGEICYKTSLDVGDAELTPALVKNAVYMNVLMMDQYLPGIMAVLYGEISPREALARIEG
jgi:hypothetical protein